MQMQVCARSTVKGRHYGWLIITDSTYYGRECFFFISAYVHIVLSLRS